MEIVDITKDQMLRTFILCFYVLIIALMFVVAECEKNKNRHICRRLFFILAIIFIVSPFFITPFLFLKETNQYTIKYNSGTLEKTITTEEIISLVRHKDVFDERKGKTSTIVINVPNNDVSNKFDEYISRVKENTDNENRNKRKAERNNKLNEKYLNETHQISVKN